MLLKKNHLFLSAKVELENLIQPLKKYHINYFTYRKFYKDNSRIFLGTRPDWLENYLSEKHYLQGNTEANPSLYQHEAVLWSTLPNQRVFQSIRDFGVDHGIYLICPKENHCEFFAFATSPQHPETINFYLNNLDILENFCLYFKDRAKTLLKQAEHQKISIPYHQREIRHYQMNDLKDIFEMRAKNQKEAQAQKSILSQRQLDCVNFLLTGATTKEIALALKLSSRTVEDYINVLKHKFNARNKGALILKLLEYRMKI